MPAWLLAALPLLAAAVILWETGLMLRYERRENWGMRRYVLVGQVFGLLTMLYLGFWLGRPVSNAGALTVIYVAVRAGLGVIAIRHRRKLRPEGETIAK